MESCRCGSHQLSVVFGWALCFVVLWVCSEVEGRGWVGVERKAGKGGGGAASSPAASDPVRISAPPAAGWIQPVVGKGKEREVGVGVGKR